MARNDDLRKNNAGSNRLSDRCLAFIDAHPRVGWYIAALLALNTLLNITDIALTLWH